MGRGEEKLYLYRVGCMHQVNEDKALSRDLILGVRLCRYCKTVLLGNITL